MKLKTLRKWNVHNHLSNCVALSKPHNNQIYPVYVRMARTWYLCVKAVVSSKHFVFLSDLDLIHTMSTIQVHPKWSVLVAEIGLLEGGCDATVAQKAAQALSYSSAAIIFVLIPIPIIRPEVVRLNMSTRFPWHTSSIVLPRLRKSDDVETDMYLSIFEDWPRSLITSWGDDETYLVTERVKALKNRRK